MEELDKSKVYWWKNLAVMLVKKLHPRSTYYWTILLAISIKVLCIPCYISTDFDVHRNWLAITHSLPLDKWYYEDTSEWTLDYPPFFAYFEYFLSKMAIWFDPDMLVISEHPYRSQATIMFQRLSVIIFSDIPLIIASLLISVYLGRQMKRDGTNESVLDLERRSFAIFFAIVMSPGIILLDNIHFQYNGILFGILLMFTLLLFRGQYSLSFLVFAILLNMKHIFLYFALPIMVFFVFQHQKLTLKSVTNTFLLFLAGLVIFGVSYGPFIFSSGGIDTEMLMQIKSRLFPFQRGLTHAYWAPNVWAVYLFVDKVIYILKLKLLGGVPAAGANARGLVGSAEIMALPAISPPMSIVLIIFASFPALFMIATAKKARREIFYFSSIFCGMIFFLFGWHVHEKAILMIVVPFTLVAFDRVLYFRKFFFLSICGTFSLFPLLYEAHETLPKHLIVAFYHLCIYIVARQLVFSRIYNSDGHGEVNLLSRPETVYLWLFGAIDALFYINPLKRSFPFLPLMATSVYCAIGIIYWTAWLGCHTWTLWREDTGFM